MASYCRDVIFPAAERSGYQLMNWIECVVTLLVAIVTTVALTPVAKMLAKRFDAIDYPDQRRINTKPTPRLGGVAIFGGIVASCLVLFLGIEFFGWINPFHSTFLHRVNFPVLALGVIVMFAIGAVDDVRGLRARWKLLGQIVAACIVAASGLTLSNMQNPFVEGGFIEFGIWSYPITVFYLVAFANIINLIDGLDGLASGISAISAATIFTFATIAGRYEAALASIIIVGVCLGFLRSNHHPASIFMGDSGSLLLGMALGIVSLFAVARSTLVVSLLVPIMAAGVPVTDTVGAIIRRLRAHQPVDEPDTEHIHHRLLKAGYSQSSTVLIMWAWTAALAICSIILAESQGWPRIIVIVIAAAITGFAIARLHLLEPVLRHHYNPRRIPRRRGKHEQDEEREGSDEGSGERGEPENHSEAPQPDDLPDDNG